MDKNQAIKLLIIEHESTMGEVYNSRLRSMGLPVRSTFFNESDDVLQLIDTAQPDVILLRHKHEEASLKDLTSYTSTLEDELPVVLLHSEDDELEIATILNDGADDMVLDTNLDHLKSVVKREAHIAQMAKQVKRLTKLHNESEIRCQSLLDNSRDSIAYVHEGMHVYANTTYLEMFGFESFDDVEGLPIMDMVVSDKQNDLKNFLRDLNTDEAAVHYNTNLVLADQSVMDADLEFSTASIDGEPCTQIIIRQQVSDANAKELEAQLTKMAKLDAHTGLLNRQVFMEEFHTSIATMEAENKEYGYFQMTLDKYDEYQQELGVVNSDQLVVDISAEFKKRLGENATICRYEGATFAYLFPIKDRTNDIKKRGEGILKVISNLSLEIGDKSLNELTMSIGVSLIDDSSIQVDEAIGRATNALETAVKKGDAYEVYRPKEGEMTQRQIDKLWSDKLEGALKENRFRLLFQPIVKLEGGEIERYEVLVRMRDEHGAEVSPGEFLPAAERSGFSKKIDRWVILNSFRSLVEQFKKGHKTILVIKLTASSLKDEELFSWVKDRVKASGLPKNCLVFEVKEESVQNNLKQAKVFAAGLQAIGCGFAIDDFGLSNDPFKLIEEVPAQFLKFDASLSKDLFSNQDNQNLISELSTKAHELQKQTILQHVEDAMTLSVIWTIGSDFIQGHFISGPLEKMSYDFTSTMA